MRKIKQIQERDIAFIIDGIRFSLFDVERTFNRILHLTQQIEIKSLTDTDLNYCFEILSGCWSIVDTTDRIASMLNSMPKLDVLIEQRRAFSKSTNRVRRMRNVYHHLGQRAKQLSASAAPFMGSLCWKSVNDDLKTYLLFLDSGAAKGSYPGLTYDRVTMKYVNNYLFCTCDEDISIEELANSCRQLSNTFELFLSDSGIHESNSVNGSLLQMKVLSSVHLTQNHQDGSN